MANNFSQQSSHFTLKDIFQILLRTIRIIVRYYLHEQGLNLVSKYYKYILWVNGNIFKNSTFFLRANIIAVHANKYLKKYSTLWILKYKGK